MRQGVFGAAIALLKNIAIILLSTAVGILAGAAVHYWHLDHKFESLAHLDGMVADLVAGAFTTGTTLYLSLYFVQIQELKAVINKGLFGLQDVDLPRAILSQAIDNFPPYAVESDANPMILCTTPETLTKRLAKLNDARVANVALAIPIDQPCAGNVIADASAALWNRFHDGERFRHVLTVRNGGQTIVGLTSANHFRSLLNPTHIIGHWDENIAKTIAKAAEMNVIDAFRAFGFVVDTVPESRNTASMIQNLVRAKANEALITNGSTVSGAVSLWRLVGLAYGIK
ncbi:MAG TPA: hypothetical protein VMF58_17285 [Rhizomicrobium sp.]|nr:hypothetical protein [Rhizomicrobium sp.]